MSQRLRTQLSFLSQREHDDSAWADIFEVAADFVYIDNECTEQPWHGQDSDLSSALNCSQLSHKYILTSTPLTLLSYITNRPYQPPNREGSEK